jgi:hypothetical protein
MGETGAVDETGTVAGGVEIIKLVEVVEVFEVEALDANDVVGKMVGPSLVVIARVVVRVTSIAGEKSVVVPKGEFMVPEGDNDGEVAFEVVVLSKFEISKLVFISLNIGLISIWLVEFDFIVEGVPSIIII